MGIVDKLLRYQREYGTAYMLKQGYYRFQIKYLQGKRRYPLSVKNKEAQRQRNWQPDRPVTVSLVVPLYNTREDFLRDMIESVQGQTYGDWELCLADASDQRQEEVAAIVEEYAREDYRIKYQLLSGNRGISENTNQGIQMTEGEYIALLDHDDILHPSALYYVVQEIQRRKADFIYTDELSFDRQPERVQSIHFKPDFSPESFCSNNYICHFSVFARELLEKAGMLRSEFDGSQDYDLLLRLTDQAEHICHVPRVLYYWRIHSGSVAAAAEAKPYTIQAGRRALEEHLKRKGLEGRVAASREYGPFYRIDYKVPEDARILFLPENRKVYGRLQEQLSTLPWEAELKPPEEQGRKILLSDSARSPQYVFLVRDGYLPEQPFREWVGELLSCLQPKESMAAAPVVFTQDGKVSHAGCYYGRAGEYPRRLKGIPGFPTEREGSVRIYPLYQGLPRHAPSYMNRLSFRQNISLLSGAVLACRDTVFREYEHRCRQQRWQWGLFEDGAWFSLCLTGMGKGGQGVITPYVSFVEDSSSQQKGRKGRWTKEEWDRFQSSWSTVLEQPDPHANPGLGRFGKYYFLWK